jgi:hypothetical protein
LLAIVDPKVVDVGGEGDGEGFATISFKTGPNIQSYDYNVSCYEQNFLVPTTSCRAIVDNNVPTEGVGFSGKTGKLYGTITNNVTELGTCV